MLIILILYTYKKGFRTSSSLDMALVLKRLAFKIKFVVLFSLLSVANVNDDVANVEKISFDVMKKNSKIGYINIEKASLNQTTTYTINSEVKAKVIFNFNARGLEKSEFKDDTLIFSSMYRKINSKEKLNHSISFKDGKYFFKNKNKKEKEVFSVGIIHKNLATLFFEEPINVQEIYSGKFIKKVKINSIGNSIYKVKLPNKSESIYHYENGKCVRIDIQGTFYKVKLIKTN